jgi:hypothetical protein
VKRVPRALLPKSFKLGTPRGFFFRISHGWSRGGCFRT